MPGPIKQILGDISEAYVEPAGDAGAEAVEQGITAATMPTKPVDPQAEAKKQAEVNRKKQNIIQFLNQYAADQQRTQSQIRAEQQKKIEAQQAVAQEHQVEQFEAKKKQKNIAVTRAKTRSEVKGSIGG